MTYYIPDNDKAFALKEKKEAESKAIFKSLIKNAVERPTTNDSQPQATYIPKHSLLERISISLSVIFYYFFAGLTVLVRGRLPKSYQVPKPEEIKFFIHNVLRANPDREEKKKYGKIIDLDNPPPKLDLLK